MLEGVKLRVAQADSSQIFERPTPMSEGPKAPKLFISYSWTTETHEDWVLTLAGQLRSNGVDVILDKWDLKHGNDTHAFMEILADPTVDKVAMICDRKYVEKANSRSGGVGVEAQIITPGVYESHKQTRYVAVVVERDDEGKAFIPIYYGSKRYIDFTDKAKEAQSYEELLRWIFDRPSHVKPPIGKVPAYIEQPELNMPTSSVQRRALDALKNGRPYAAAAVSEYFDIFSEHLEVFRIQFAPEDTDDLFIESVEKYLPYKHELVEIFAAIARYQDTEALRDCVQQLFESILRYQGNVKGVGSYREIDFDNFKFMIHEAFLSLIAVNIRDQRHYAVLHYLEAAYHTGQKLNAHPSPSSNYMIFWEYLKVLEWRNQRLGLRRTSLHGDLLISRCENSPVRPIDMLTADFVLYLRSKMSADETFGWYPTSLVYTSEYVSHGSAFAMFARATSRKAFERIKDLFSAADGDDFRNKIAYIIADRSAIPSWNHRSLDIKGLSNAKNIDTSD